jgi:hypothetical protein
MPTLHVLTWQPGPCRTRRCCQSSLQQAALSCLCRLSLHALVFGNLRAVAFLWGRFVRELRFSHWETLTPLPRMPGGALVAAYTCFGFGHMKGVGSMTPTQLVWQQSHVLQGQWSMDCSGAYSSLRVRRGCGRF